MPTTTAVAAARSIIAPRDLTIRSLAACHSVAGAAAGVTIAYTLFLDGTSTGFATALAADAAVSDYTSGTIPVLKGQRVEIRAIASGALGANPPPGGVIVGLRFD
ncbi:MAG: hypothetical protein HC882_00365 [Acidobacteria bacterium]|nr:hypothetical protein [Acidobacteriota bacterium]